jgi:hypothetical protein
MALTWPSLRVFVPFKLAHEECQFCLQELHTRFQSLPSDDAPQGHTVLLERDFFFTSDDLKALSLSDIGESV